ATVEKPSSLLMAVVTGGVVSAVLAVPSLPGSPSSSCELIPNRKSIPNGTLELAGSKIGYVALVATGISAAAGGLLVILLSYLSVVLTLQPAKPAAVAAMARLRRVFFTILLPVYVFLWLLVHFRDARRTN